MEEMTSADRIALVNAIAGREGTASQIALWYDTSVEWLRSFVEDNREELEETRLRILEAESEVEQSSDTITPVQLDDLWITKKFDRLKRLQKIADLLYEEAQHDPTDSTVLRELRSYLVAAANELGQLLHRGSGESGTDSLSVDIQGVDLDNLR
jgi:hypothetical protein